MVDKEQEQLKRLIKRAKELQLEEGKNSLRKRVEGQLLKFTNVVKGYQYRWCVVDPDSGTVDYYEKEEHKRSNKPRGSLNLTYASVCPSDEDSQAFVIYAANGDSLKLKAADAKERQFWVNRVRAVAEYFTEKAENNPVIASLPKKLDSSQPGSTISDSHVTSYLQPPNSAFVNPPNQTPSKQSVSSRNESTPVNSSSSFANGSQNLADNLLQDSRSFPVFCPANSTDPRAQLRELFQRLEAESQTLISVIDAAAVHSPELTAVYKTLLLSKATSQATVSCLKRCMDLLKRRDRRNQDVPEHGIVFDVDGSSADPQAELDIATAAGATILCGKKSAGDVSSIASQSSIAGNAGLVPFPSPILNMDPDTIKLPEFPGDAEPDAPLDEAELGSVENQKHIILHLLSQLRLDMDLTKIVLPTFILEKRSLLEMFADYLAHPDLFLNINLAKTPESRMLAFVQWYLTSFHVGKKDKVAKKPYNPVIGETFHCCWLVPKDAQTENASTDAESLITYCAEQVSHHPPITAFHVTSPAHGMQLNSSVHTKSKFHGMSISVTMVGETVLRLGQHNDEEYHFNFPTAYAHSILTVPWFEMGGKVTISCPQTGYSAAITFHTKPMRSNKLHRISGELFAPEDPTLSDTSSRQPFAKVSGEWNGVLEFEMLRSNDSKKWTIDVNSLPVNYKLVRPIEKQRPEESRMLWQHVTSALQAGNLQLATEKKRELEERQRVSEKYRARHRIAFPVKFFHWNGKAWIFQNPGCQSA